MQAAEAPARENDLPVRTSIWETKTAARGRVHWVRLCADEEEELFHLLELLSGETCLFRQGWRIWE